MGFSGGAETRYKKYPCKGSCKRKSYETICENIVSRYQTLVSSLPRMTVFRHRRPKTEFMKKRLNFSLLKNFETKMADLGSDLFILFSVYPMREKDGVGRPYQYQKIRIKPCSGEQHGHWLRPGSGFIPWLIKKTTFAVKAFVKFLFRYFLNKQKNK